MLETLHIYEPSRNDSKLYSDDSTSVAPSPLNGPGGMPASVRDNYEVVGTLGEGSYGTVYLVRGRKGAEVG